MLVEKNNNTPFNDCTMQISAYSMQGRRCHMEDYFDIGYLMKPAKLQKPNEWPYEYFYLGVFDGHGGYQAASFAKENLLKLITKQRKFWSNDDDDVLEAIRIGFAETHQAMLEEMPTWTRTNRVLPSTAGTTASILFIRNGKFYTGHVGDSRIVVSSEHPDTKNWRHEELTQDHKPENEIERIENAGGQVKTKIGVHRVVWKRPILCRELEEKLTAEPRHPSYDSFLGSVASYPINDDLVVCYQTIPFLAIARSLGDFWSYNPDNGEYVVSPEPDVMCRPISSRDKCILLATDGLWNVMHSSQASRFLQELKIVKEGKRESRQYSDTYFATDNFYDISNSKDEENHALSLVFMAYQIWERRRLRSDNITAVVAMLSDILTPQQNVTVDQSPENCSRAYTEAYIANHGFQLGKTHLVCQSISLNKKTKFQVNYEDNLKSEEKLKKLEDQLLFPPSIMDTELFQSCVRAPQNYIRLSNAKCRQLPRSDDYPDDIIYIKEVSDDPADSMKSPPRKNIKNIEIRDSSAQATQSMHDFGQQWGQLIDNSINQEFGVGYSKYDDMTLAEYYNENPSDETDTSESEQVSSNTRAKSGKIKESFCVDVEDKPHDVPKISEDTEIPRNNMAIHDDQISTILDEIRSHLCETRSKNNEVDKGDECSTNHPIDQVLSVVSENRTPVTCRSTRKSATENPKRKLEIEIGTCPKTKRRKSHPIHSIAAITKG